MYEYSKVDTPPLDSHVMLTPPAPQFEQLQNSRRGFGVLPNDPEAVYYFSYTHREWLTVGKIIPSLGAVASAQFVSSDSTTSALPTLWLPELTKSSADAYPFLSSGEWLDITDFYNATDLSKEEAKRRGKTRAAFHYLMWHLDPEMAAFIADARSPSRTGHSRNNFEEYRDRLGCSVISLQQTRDTFENLCPSAVCRHSVCGKFSIGGIGAAARSLISRVVYDFDTESEPKTQPRT